MNIDSKKNFENRQRQPKKQEPFGQVHCFVRWRHTEPLSFDDFNELNMSFSGGVLKFIMCVISFLFVQIAFGQSSEELIWIEIEARAIDVPYNGEEFISQDIPFDSYLDEEIHCNHSSFKNSRIDVLVAALDKPVCFFVFDRGITETRTPITSFVSKDSSGLPLCPGFAILSNINSVTSVATLCFEKLDTIPFIMSGNLDSLKYPTAIASEPMSGFCFAIFNGDTLKSFMLVLSIMNWTKSNFE